VASVLFLKLAKQKTFFHKDENYEKSLGDEERSFLIQEREGKSENSLEKTNIRERALEKLGNFYYVVL
jgi:hypothetical protein